MLVDERYNLLLVKIVILWMPFFHQFCIFAVEYFTILRAGLLQYLFHNQVGDSRRANIFPAGCRAFERLFFFLAAITTLENVVRNERKVWRVCDRCAARMEPISAFCALDVMQSC